MEEKKCPSCGAPLVEGATVCLRCLEPLSEKTPVETERPPLGMRRAVIFSSVLFAAALIIIVLMFSSRAKTPDAPETETAGAAAKSEKVSRTESISPASSAADGQTGADSGTDSGTVTVEATPSEDYTAPYVTPDTEKEAPPPATETERQTQTEKGPETKAALQAAESVSVHVHTSACYEKVIDVPYKPATYYTEDVYKTVDDAVVYSVYRVYLYRLDDPTVSEQTLFFPNESEYNEWKNENAANMGTYDGRDYVVYNGKMSYYEVYSEQREAYTVLEHRKGDLMAPEQQEVSHYELVCGYE